MDEKKSQPPVNYEKKIDSINITVLISVLTVFLATIYFFSNNSNEDISDKNISSFYINNDIVGKYYRGLDVDKFYMLYRDKVNSATKGEFETKSEYENRTRKLKKNIFPFNLNEKYAFCVDGINIAYDADREVFHLKNLFLSDKFQNFKVINIYQSKNEKSDYLGTNAFGAKIEVHKIIEEYIGLAIDKNNELYSKIFSNIIKNIDAFSYEFDVDINTARIFEGKDLSLLFVGSVTGDEAFHFYSILSKPTFNDPIDKTRKIKSIPFILDKIILFNSEDGKIISSFPVDDKYINSNDVNNSKKLTFNGDYSTFLHTYSNGFSDKKNEDNEKMLNKSRVGFEKNEPVSTENIYKVDYNSCVDWIRIKSSEKKLSGYFKCRNILNSIYVCDNEGFHIEYSCNGSVASVELFRQNGSEWKKYYK